MVFARRDWQLRAVQFDSDSQRTRLEVAPGLPGTAHAGGEVVAGGFHVHLAALAKLEAAQADHRRDDGRHSQAEARLAAKREAGRIQLAS